MYCLPSYHAMSGQQDRFIAVNIKLYVRLHMESEIFIYVLFSFKILHSTKVTYVYIYWVHKAMLLLCHTQWTYLLLHV